MSAAYHRHAASAAGAGSRSNARVSHRSDSSRDHLPTWSASNNEGIGANPMVFTTSEDDITNLASTTTSLLDGTHEKKPGSGWALLAPRVR
jgi:hypothetical protein